MANEKRLIDANELIEDLEAAKANSGMGSMVAGALIRYVKRCTTVSAVEVVHGRWNEINQINTGLPWKYRCSECGCPQDYAHNYCPNCGAKMDGGNEDG